MAIRLPENLAPENYPIAWLLDSWCGGGVLEYEGIEPAAYLHELTIDARDAGPYVRLMSRIWLAHEPAEAVDKEASGQYTYNSLTKARLWSAVTGYLRVNPQASKRADGASELEAMLAAPSGTAQLWVGLINGPRLQMVTDTIVRSSSGAQLDGAKLIAGNVASDLFYAYDMEAFGSPMRSYLAGRLSRQFNDEVDAPASQFSDGELGDEPRSSATPADLSES
ncbi:FABP family protein [Trueperella sp. LYQ143]|uniref:FABP family protein n=1 Tax=unclassified Trueperella TaxID=2630174 RepID=UPI003982DD1C